MRQRELNIINVFLRCVCNCTKAIAMETGCVRNPKVEKKELAEISDDIAMGAEDFQRHFFNELRVLTTRFRYGTRLDV